MGTPIGPSGVGGPSNVTPSQKPEAPGGDTKGQIKPTMNAMRDTLHAQGKDDLFQKFQMSFILPMVQQTQKAMDRAKQAAKKMREQ